MAIDDLPLPVVNLLNLIGVPWPYVDEQTISQLAAFTRQFGTAVQTTHEDAGRQVAGIATAYKSASSEQMNDGWARLSSRHVSEITEGCTVLASALDAAADYVIAAKAAAIAQLLVLAGEVGGDIVAGIFTGGLADALLPEIEAAADKIVQSLIMDLEQTLIAKVISAALKPLMAKVEAALAGLDWSQTGAAAVGKGAGLELDAPAARAHAQALATYASDMRSHAQKFAGEIRGLAF
ncbi:MAG: hypothetical protein J2P29_12560 [Actinobacteria bacterium]|nr:hypothetical protein [Actinomycetota bacterium]